MAVLVAIIDVYERHSHNEGHELMFRGGMAVMEAINDL